MKLAALLALLAVAAAPAHAMPNPAAAFCASKAGGASQVLTGPDGGQTGFCSFGGADAAIEEWTLFRAGGPATPAAGGSGVAAPPPQAAVSAFLASVGATPPAPATSTTAVPAPSNPCTAAGAVAATYKCAKPLCALGSPTLTVCTFPDRSMIAAQALGAGPKGAPLLAAALK